jgi:prolipoprotein diacylglyceryltransferase
MKNLFIIIFAFSIFMLATQDAFAQCSVCRASAESNVEQGYSAGKGLNTGILYLLSIPYVLGGVGFYIWYSQRKKNKAKENLSQSLAD